MPQLDPYIFLHQIVTLIVFFFLIYFYVRKNIIPKLNSILKYRNKKISKLLHHDKGNWRLYNKSNVYYSWLACIYLNKTNSKISLFFNKNISNCNQWIQNKKINNYFNLIKIYQKSPLAEIKRTAYYITTK
jgi:hypothetical protein